MTDTSTITRRDGVDAYGLYLDYIHHSAIDGSVVKQLRYFLAGNVLCKYSRDSGKKRAAWHTYKCTSREEARLMLTTAIAALPSNVEQIYKPLIVELTETDVLALEKGEAPVARFTGTAATEKAVGKVDDKTWKAEAWR